MTGATSLALSPGGASLVEQLDAGLPWLAAWTIHNANYLRESGDGLEVGGIRLAARRSGQSWRRSMFKALRPQDKVAVKPPAGPIPHAIHYLLGNQSRDMLERFHGFGGVQSYPSRIKDVIPVDFRPDRPA